jgi:hypothetical protein
MHRADQQRRGGPPVSASADRIHALVSVLNERGSISYGDIVALLDALIEKTLREFAIDLHRHGLAADEIEARIEAQIESMHEWKTEVLCDVARTFLHVERDCAALIR